MACGVVGSHRVVGCRAFDENKTASRGQNLDPEHKKRKFKRRGVGSILAYILYRLRVLYIHVRGQIREKSSALFLTAFEGMMKSASKNSHAEIFKKMAIFTLILIYLHVKQ